jgi:hypothetical protein
MRTHVEWEKIQAIPSGAKAQSHEANAQGLKPLPPKGSGKTAEEGFVAAQTPNVRAKAPSPSAVIKEIGS